ncbi:MAG: class I adenylate-forming enzyme family protein [Deltaproteobacteria bacterium]
MSKPSPDPSKNIGLAFRRVAEANPDLPAIIAADITLTYAKLRQVADVFAYRMYEHGIASGSLVALQTRDIIASIATMLGASMLGAQFTTLEKELLETAAVTPTHLLRSPDATPIDGLKYIVMDESWSPKHTTLPTDAPTLFPDLTDAEADWWIIHTSGTTGAPKYMGVSQRVVFDRSMAARVDFHPHQTRLCSLFNCTARPFYVRATAALLNACTIVDTVDPAFMSNTGVTLVCGAPRQVVAWLDGRVLKPKLPLLQVSGSRLSDETAKILLASFDRVEDVYGASETNKSFVNVKAMVGESVVATGKPCDSVIEILSDSFAPCPPGVIGHVRVQNPYMVNGYIDAPEANASAFQNGWFHPGDYGLWGERGELIIHGRSDDVINIGGRKIAADAVDRALMVDGIDSAVCFRDPRIPDLGGLVALVVLSPGADPDHCVATAHAACLSALGATATPSHIFVVKEIPVTFDGVPRRNECQRLILNLLQGGASNGPSTGKDIGTRA